MTGASIEQKEMHSSHYFSTSVFIALPMFFLSICVSTVHVTVNASSLGDAEHRLAKFSKS